MFVGTDTNYTLGSESEQFMPVFSKSIANFRLINADSLLVGCRFIHDPETDNQILFSVYEDGVAVNYPLFDYACVTGFTSFSVNLGFPIPETGGDDSEPSRIYTYAYYHLIIPVENVNTGEIKYLAVKMSGGNELSHETAYEPDYYYLYDTIGDAAPESAEPPAGGGNSDFSTATVTIDFTLPNDTIDHYIFDSVAFYYPGNYDSGVYYTIGSISQESNTLEIVLYKGVGAITDVIVESNNTVYRIPSFEDIILSGGVAIDSNGIFTISGDCTISCNNLIPDTY